MKKVSFFVYDIYQMGGIEKVVSLIANELAKNYEVEIISLYKKSNAPFYKLDPKIKVWNILEKQLDPIKLYYPYLMYRTRKALKNLKTDIFICAGMGYVGLNIFMRKRVKYIAWEHSNSLHGKKGGIMWLGRKLAAKYADKIVVLTKKDEKINCEKYNSDGKLFQIYNHIEKTKQYHEYVISSNTIVSVGRLSFYEKGLDYLVDVASKVFDKHPDWKWHLYGEGDDRSKVEELIKEKQIEDKFILKGQTKNMNALYREYSMFVLSSRYEGFCMVNIEAHYAKLPIVCFNVNCGPDEIIKDGVNGYLIDCYDTDAMANKINYLIENEELRQKMSDNTMLDKEKLQIENILEKWHQIIED